MRGGPDPSYPKGVKRWVLVSEAKALPIGDAPKVTTPGTPNPGANDPGTAKL